MAAGTSGALHTGKPAARQRARRCRHHPKSWGTLAANRRAIQRGQSKAGKCASLSRKEARHTGISFSAVRWRKCRCSTQRLGAKPRSSPVGNCEQRTQMLPPSRRRTSCKRCSIHCATWFKGAFPLTKDTSAWTRGRAPSAPAVEALAWASCSAKACSKSGRMISPSPRSMPPKQAHASASPGAKMPQKAREGRALSKHKWT
mmetsp:Transcript_53452/g.114947  ORF Transcript_53452/g.114947 Transcript_53452/m.114947 type:complete len:202 (-) Transcript_53452:1071-1676(-)